MALPAFGAGDPAPVMGATAPEELMPTPEPIRGAVVPAVEPASVEAVEAAEAVPAVSTSAVARAAFATAIDQREPVDSISSLGSDRDRVYYFTEFVGLSAHDSHDARSWVSPAPPHASNRMSCPHRLLRLLLRNRIFGRIRCRWRQSS